MFGDPLVMYVGVASCLLHSIVAVVRQTEMQSWNVCFSCLTCSHACCHYCSFGGIPLGVSVTLSLTLVDYLTCHPPATPVVMSPCDHAWASAQKGISFVHPVMGTSFHLTESISLSLSLSQRSMNKLAV